MTEQGAMTGKPLIESDRVEGTTVYDPQGNNIGSIKRLMIEKLRAHPGSLDSERGICGKSPEHDADHGEADECSNGRCVAFKVASQTTVTTNPRERAFDDPPFRQHLKSSSVRSLDDVQIPGTSAPHRHRHLASRVCAVSKNASQMSEFQDGGIILTHRGQIELLKREELKKRDCVCYEMRRHVDRLLPPTAQSK
jgi:hypothetical protein